VLRHGLRLILQEDPALTVVGEAGSGAEVVAQTNQLAPDVVLLDLNLFDTSSVHGIRQIRMSSPQTQVLVLTTADQNGNIAAACKAGAKGYLLKDVGGAEVVRAIHRIADGEAVLPPSLTTRLLDELADPPPTPDCLTNREVDVVRCLSKGLGNKEIANTLSISQNTVKTHVRRILGKLNLRNRTEAATYAMQMNLL
jgi:DNA-binding NarL/FixJ family response regulator